MVHVQSKPKAPRKASLPQAQLRFPNSSQFLTTNLEANHDNQFRVNEGTSLAANEHDIVPKCMAQDCPLVQAGIEHSQGLYRQNGQHKMDRISVLFGASNPPDFVWDADDARRKARDKIQRGEEVEENLKIQQQAASVVTKFCDYHSSN